jgi:peptide/nickel transport system substrate-binding protein
MTGPTNGATDLDMVVRSALRSDVNRRRFLIGAAAVGGAGLLAACGGGGGGNGGNGGAGGGAGAAAGVAELPGGTPVRGGTFNVGVLTLGAAENLFPGTAVPMPDVLRGFSLYNLLFYPNDQANLYPLQPGLALSSESNADATQWTFKLRDGITWHNGKPFGADDVVYNITQLWGNDQQNYSASFLKGVVDFPNVKAVDKLTVQIPLLVPTAQFPSIFAWFNFGVLPVGATPQSAPVGTGPFKYESFTPGKQSVFVRNENYWEEGKPYVDRLVVDSSFSDANAMLNALLGGQINLLVSPAAQQVRQQVSAKQVQILQSAGASTTYAFGMRVDEGPFADPRIRQAFKLFTDRQALINGALAGFGTVGNDLQGPNTEYFASDMKSEFDPDKAKSLFQAAGVAGHTFELPVANVLPGMVESSTIWAQQAEKAGIKITLKTLQPGDYWTSAGGAYVRPFSIQIAQPLASLTGQYRSLIQKGAPYWDTYWGAQKDGGQAATDLILQAESTLDATKANDLWRKVQEQQHNDGGYVVWAGFPYIDFAANNVRGLKASGGLPFNNFRFQDGWIAS